MRHLLKTLCPRGVSIFRSGARPSTVYHGCSSAPCWTTAAARPTEWPPGRVAPTTCPRSAPATDAQHTSLPSQRDGSFDAEASMPCGRKLERDLDANAEQQAVLEKWYMNM